MVLYIVLNQIVWVVVVMWLCAKIEALKEVKVWEYLSGLNMGRMEVHAEYAERELQAKLDAEKEGEKCPK